MTRRALANRKPDLGVMTEALPLLVDDHVGVVHQVQEVPTEPGSPNFFHYAAKACNTSAFAGQVNFSNTGGASTHRPVAVAKAVGEAVERYCAALYQAQDLPLCSYREADFACVHPGDFALHSADQYDSPGFPWVPFTEDTPIRWTPAQDLGSGETLHVPAAFVWIPYHYRQGTGDSPIGQPISTGLACHGSFAQAALSGLCEAIERDAFTIMWQARLAMPQIRVETLSDDNYDLVQRFERTGDRVVLLDITLDAGVPTVLSVLCSDAAARPAYVFAASADPDPERAVQKALEELAHTRRYSQQIKRNLPPVVADDDYEQVQTQLDHLNFAGDPANRDHFEFVFASRERVEFDDLPNLAGVTPERTLTALVERIQSTGHRALVADLTSPDIRHLGLTVARSLVPGYHPLYMGHRLRALGGRRLWEVPQRLGREQPQPGGSNPAPHPYP
jgi:ribosomal protein S12 methylthiotransferase accessory factor